MMRITKKEGKNDEQISKSLNWFFVQIVYFRSREDGEQRLFFVKSNKDLRKERGNYARKKVNTSKHLRQ